MVKQCEQSRLTIGQNGDCWSVQPLWDVLKTREEIQVGQHCWSRSGIMMGPFTWEHKDERLYLGILGHGFTVTEGGS